MSPANVSEGLRMLEQWGHSFTLVGQEIKVVSREGCLADPELRWLRLNKTKVTNALLARTLSRSIDKIEKAYRPGIHFEGFAEVRKGELDRMELNSLADIGNWERGWLALIAQVTQGGGI